MSHQDTQTTETGEQLSDFDPELREELQRTAAAMDGNTAQADIESVRWAEHRAEDVIEIEAKLPWGDIVTREFDAPKNDPGGDFETFVNGLGYDLNAAHHIVEQDVDVTCEFDASEETWTLPIPKTRRERWRDSARAVKSAATDGDNIFATMCVISGLLGGIILYPIVAAALQIGFIIEAGNDDEMDEPPLFFLAMILLVGLMIWMIIFIPGLDMFTTFDVPLADAITAESGSGG